MYLNKNKAIKNVNKTIHNQLKCGKSPFWQDNALFASKAKTNVF